MLMFTAGASPLVHAPAQNVHVHMHASVHVRASGEEGEVYNHLIQTYSRGISLLNPTAPFEPYLVSISHFSFRGRCRNLIPFV